MKKKQIEEIAITYNRLQDDLYNDLRNEFHDDLPKWNAILDRTNLSVRFREPKVLFEAGRADIRPRFKEILNSFFPRYIRILTNPKYKDDIEEIRIEGHTSSDWRDADLDTAYFNNMALSQARTRSVLHYVLMLPEIDKDRDWLKKDLTANGLSSSKLILVGNREDHEESRRVEFRIRTNAESRIVQILRHGEER